MFLQGLLNTMQIFLYPHLDYSPMTIPVLVEHYRGSTQFSSCMRNDSFSVNAYSNLYSLFCQHYNDSPRPPMMKINNIGKQYLFITPKRQYSNEDSCWSFRGWWYAGTAAELVHFSVDKMTSLIFCVVNLILKSYQISISQLMNI